MNYRCLDLSMPPITTSINDDNLSRSRSACSVVPADYLDLFLCLTLRAKHRRPHYYHGTVYETIIVSVETADK